MHEGGEKTIFKIVAAFMYKIQKINKKFSEKLGQVVDRYCPWPIVVEKEQEMWIL